MAPATQREPARIRPKRAEGTVRAGETPLSPASSIVTVREEPTSRSVGQQYRNYKALVDRAVEVFGDDLTASQWLRMPSADLAGKVPLQVAQGFNYDARQLETRFEPIFIRIEHGIDW